MTYEMMIKEYSKAMQDLVQVELAKSTIELTSLDLTSKETMVKLSTQLQQSNMVYNELCSELLKLKSKVTVLDKELGIVKELIAMSILKTPEQVDSFVSSIREPQPN